jgi:hypothetical protein
MKLYNKHHKNAPKEAVYIGRGSKYGNPFIMGKDGNRDEVCDKYEGYVEANPSMKADFISELKGKDLVCYCAPRRCHGDYLIKICGECTKEINNTD